MSDYPFKVGDLVEFKASKTKKHWPGQVLKGVIVAIKVKGIFFDVLVDGQLRTVHRDYLVTPKVQSARITGGIKDA